MTVALGGLLATWTTASAATITASFDAGYSDVVINGYGTDGMGMFLLDDGGTERLALCVEADVSHSDSFDAYSLADPTIDAPELDALLWWLERQPVVDDNTAVAAAALAWYYADAQRGAGLPVWADGARGFAPISPTEPHGWNALPAMSLSHPVGLTGAGTHLDAAERRVADLHTLATRLAPPWDLSLDRSGQVKVHSDTGPLVGIGVTMTIERPDETDLVVDLHTDGAGRAAIDLPDAPDGATIRAVVEVPGRHQEWDGTDIQRMATSTSETLTRTATLPPLPRHVEVHKRSSDPTIGAAGAEFELVDATGVTVERATTSPAGVAAFRPIDVDVHPPPWSIVEQTAPPGLVRDGVPATLADASVDPEDPTVTEFVNHPATVGLVVHKRLSTPGAGPSDRAGFAFTVTRRADGRSHQATTTGDGRTGLLPLPVGAYEVCETSVPDWARALDDGGCVEVTVDVDALAGPPIVVDYLNVVPAPSIDTHAADPADGDRSIRTGTAAVTDRVSLDHLVPGTAYTVVGQVVRADSGTVVDMAPPPPSAPATTRQEFVADGTSERLDLRFDIVGTPPGAYVIVEWLLIGDEVVARHHALDDDDQMFEIVPSPNTTTTTSTTTTTTPTTVATTTPTPITTVPPTTVTIPPPTLPPTGSSEFLGRLLDWADASFVVGIALVAVGTTRRRNANEAGR